MIKQLKGSIREYKKESIKTPIFVSLEVVLECLIPFIVANLVNTIKAGAQINEIIRYGIILVIMAGLSLCFGVLSGMSSAKASAGFAKNLRKDMYYSIQNYSFENIDRFVPSSLVTRMTTDVTNVQRAFMMLIRVAVRAPFMLVFAFTMAFIMGGRLAWIFVVLVPLMAIILFTMVRKVIPLFRRVFRKYDNVNASIQENIKAMRVVKSFVREEYEDEKFYKSAKDLADDFTKAERILALTGPFFQFSIFIVMTYILTFGSYLIISTRGMELDVGQISAMYTYSFMILNSLMMTSMIFAMIVMAQESAKRIVEVIDEESTLANLPNPVYEIQDGSIEFENVSFKYYEKAKRFALKDINLKIRSGENIGIIGGTGSAKSTLVQLIPRLYDTSEGVVKVSGRDVRDYDIETLRDNVAVVLQKNILFSGTIKENLRWGNKDATDEEIIEAAKLASAHDFIMDFPKGYDTYIEQGGSNVSGGQKQRLCIARALLKNPKILIMDDSTSAVDTKTDYKIQEGLKTYIPQTTKITIAQRISSVESADRIIVMEGGSIDQIGTHEELIETNDIYREIYESQNKAGADDEQN